VLLELAISALKQGESPERMVRSSMETATLSGSAPLHHLGGEPRDVRITVKVRGGDAQAVGVKVHVAEDVGKGKAVVVLADVGLPEEQEAAFAAP